ncbi:MAG: hypothetical protein ACQESK_00765 [Bacteroidota bacterium]
MKIKIVFLFILLCFGSCNKLKKQKLNVDEIVNEELNNISFNEVDAYPSFNDCNPEREENLERCFFNKITTQLEQNFQSKDWDANSSKNDTIKIHFVVTHSNKIKLEQIEIPNRFKNQTLAIEKTVKQSFQELPPIYAAQKRGVPVTSAYQIPLIIVTE